VSQKPLKCPVCGSNKIASYLWGEPAFSEKLQQDLDEEYVLLGGYCISDVDPFCACIEF